MNDPFSKSATAIGSELHAAVTNMVHTHRGTRGSLREVAFRRTLRQMLPKRFGVGTGEIVDAMGNRSPQLDVIVYDRSEGFLFSEIEDTIVAPIESVYGV